METYIPPRRGMWTTEYTSKRHSMLNDHCYGKNEAEKECQGGAFEILAGKR